MSETHVSIIRAIGVALLFPFIKAAFPLVDQQYIIDTTIEGDLAVHD